MQLLRDTAIVRFPNDAPARWHYVNRVLDASDRHDEQYYWISEEAFAALRQEFGPRQALTVNGYPPGPDTVREPCVHLGEPTGTRIACRSCGGKDNRPVYQCKRFQQPTVKGHPHSDVPANVRACGRCDAYEKEMTHAPDA